MAFFSWGERSQIRNAARSEVIGNLADREQRVTDRELGVRRHEIDQEGDRMRNERLNQVHDDLQSVTNQAKFELEKASFAVEKNDFEITKANVANDKLQLEKMLDQAKTDFEAQMQVKVMEQAASNIEEKLGYQRKAAEWEAQARAKDLIIESKDQEIIRLDELLKVTMGKLTQIDVKGLTIHVENDHTITPKDKE
jgi:hypothetical protein